MADPLQLRAYRPADEPAVWELHVAASTAVDAFADPECCDSGVETEPEDHAAESRRLASEGAFLVGVVNGDEDDDTIVAMGALDPLDDETAELTRMRVDPDRWRNGYGQRLLDALEARAVEWGVASVELETLARQTPARGLYEVNGFEQVDRTLAGDYEVLTYRKRL